MPSFIRDQASGVAQQPRSIVHGRAVQLAVGLVDHANKWRPAPDDTVSKWLALNDGVDARLDERRDGGGMVIGTRKGRIRVRCSVRVESAGVDRSDVEIDVVIRPAGVVGRVLWWVAERAHFFDDAALAPDLELEKVIDQLGATEADWADVRAELFELAAGKI